MSIQEPANLEAFNVLLASTPYLVVDFYATWCPPCKAIAPIFQQLANTSTTASKNITFAKVNVDAAPDIAKQYSVTAMPSFLFFERGQPFADKPLVRGADPRSLHATVTTLTAKAKAVGDQPEPEATKTEPEAAKADPEAAKAEPETAKAEPEAAKAEPEAAKAEPEAAKAGEAEAGEAKTEGEAETVSGGYHFTQAEQHRSDWKTSLT